MGRLHIWVTGFHTWRDKKFWPMKNWRISYWYIPIVSKALDSKILKLLRPQSSVSHQPLAPIVKISASRIQRPEFSIQIPASSTCVQSPGILVCPLSVIMVNSIIMAGGIITVNNIFVVTFTLWQIWALCY